MAHGGKEGALLRQSTAIRHHAESIHLQAVVVMEAEGLVLDDARVKLETGGLEALPGARMAAVKNRHVVLLGHLVNRPEKTEEILLRVDILLPVRAQQNVLPFLQPQAHMDVGSLNLGQVVVQHLGHRRARHIRALLRQARIGQIAPGVLGIGHIDVGNDIDNAAVGLLRQAFVLAAVAGLHVEDGDVQPLGADHAQAGIRIAQHQHGVRLDGHHELVAGGDDVAHRLAQVLAHGIHIDLRRGQLQVLEEHAVKVVVVVLAGMRQDGVEISAALVDDGRKADDLRAGADDNQKLEFTIVGKRNVAIVHNAKIVDYSTGSKKVSGRFGSKSSFAHISVTSGSVSDRLMMLCV